MKDPGPIETGYEQRRNRERKYRIAVTEADLKLAVRAWAIAKGVVPPDADFEVYIRLYTLDYSSTETEPALAVDIVSDKSNISNFSGVGG